MMSDRVHESDSDEDVPELVPLENQKVPITIITGFLGMGTDFITLFNKILALQPLPGF